MKRLALIGAAAWMAACAASEPPAAAPKTAPPLVPAPAPPPADPCLAPAGPIETFGRAPNATWLVADERELFWTDGRTIWAASTDGGAPRVVGRLEAAQPIIELRVTPDRIVALASKNDFNSPTCVDRIFVFARGGGAGRAVGESGCITDFDVTDDRAVYAVLRRAKNGLIQATLLATSLDGRDTRTVFDFFPGPAYIHAHASRAYLSLRPGRLDVIALSSTSGTQLYNGRIGNAHTDLIPSLVAADDDSVYFATRYPEGTGLTIFATSKTEEVEPREIGQLLAPSRDASGPPWPRGEMTQTTTHLHWAATTRGRVLRIAKSGDCPVEELAIWRAAPDFATPSGPHVYWVEGDAEKKTIVRRRVRP